MPQMISQLHVRVSREEAAILQEMAAIQQAPLSSVVRAMIRHFVIEWQAGRDISIDLGAVVWRRTP